MDKDINIILRVIIVYTTLQEGKGLIFNLKYYLINYHRPYPFIWKARLEFVTVIKFYSTPCS